MRFSIKDLLWLAVVVAMGCALFVEHRRLRRVQFSFDQYRWTTEVGIN